MSPDPSAGVQLAPIFEQVLHEIETARNIEDARNFGKVAMILAEAAGASAADLEHLKIGIGLAIFLAAAPPRQTRSYPPRDPPGWPTIFA